MCKQACNKIIKRWLKRFIRKSKICLVYRETREEFRDIGTSFGIAWWACYTSGTGWVIVRLGKNMLFTHLHDRLEVARLIWSVEWPYHGHPCQSKTKVNHRQYESRLADKTRNRAHR
jgi:hypothetical protein